MKLAEMWSGEKLTERAKRTRGSMKFVFSSMEVSQSLKLYGVHSMGKSSFGHTERQLWQRCTRHTPKTSENNAKLTPKRA